MSLAHGWPNHKLRTGALPDLYHFYRLLLYRIKRMRLELDLMEVDIHQIDAADIAVPGCPVIQLHGLEVSRSSKLCGTRHTLRYISLQMLTADRNIEIVQDMEGLHDSIESVVPYRSRSLEERCTYES